MVQFSSIKNGSCGHRKLWFVLLAARVAFGLVFIYIGIMKIAVTPFTLENGFWTGVTAWLLPWVEIIAGLLLIGGLGLLPAKGRIAGYYLARIILGLIFFYSGLVKIADAQLFVTAVENYRLLPDFLTPFFAVVLPWVELVAGFALISGFKALPAVTLINLLIIVFIVALSISYFRGLNIDCGCFNVNITNSKHSLLEAIWRDCGFLALGLWIAVYLQMYKKERI